MITRTLGRCFCSLAKVVNNIIIIATLCNLELRECMVDTITKKRGKWKGKDREDSLEVKRYYNIAKHV